MTARAPDLCTTPGCPNAVRVYVSDEPLRCDGCRAAAQLAALRVDVATRCVHLGAPVDPWLRDHGTPEGRARWIDSMWRGYERVLSGRRAGRPRTEPEARRAAAAHWRYLRNLSLQALPFARSCALGYACGTTAQVLDFGVRGGRTFEMRSAVVCDRQGSCRGYMPAQPAVNDQRPAGPVLVIAEAPHG